MIKKLQVLFIAVICFGCNQNQDSNTEGIAHEGHLKT